METEIRIHISCGGVVEDEPQDDEWGKWDLPVCRKCQQGPIVEESMARIYPPSAGPSKAR